MAGLKHLKLEMRQASPCQRLAESQSSPIYGRTEDPRVSRRLYKSCFDKLLDDYLVVAVRSEGGRLRCTTLQQEAEYTNNGRFFRQQPGFEWKLQRDCNEGIGFYLSMLSALNVMEEFLHLNNNSVCAQKAKVQHPEFKQGDCQNNKDNGGYRGDKGQKIKGGNTMELRGIITVRDVGWDRGLGKMRRGNSEAVERVGGQKYNGTPILMNVIRSAKIGNQSKTKDQWQ
nr:hypothetical protein Iba_chr07bCG5950 [Ipomoea batatas]